MRSLAQSETPFARDDVLSSELGRSHPCPARTPDRPMKATAERWACTRMRSRTAALYLRNLEQCRVTSAAETVEGRRPVEGRVSCDACPGLSAGTGMSLKQRTHGSELHGYPNTPKADHIRPETRAPDAGKPHIRICAGGEEQSSSLPRPFRRGATIVRLSQHTVGFRKGNVPAGTSTFDAISTIVSAAVGTSAEVLVSPHRTLARMLAQ